MGLLACLLLNVFPHAQSEASKSPTGCIDGQGNSVDFWYALKSPDGWNFAYFDSNDKAFRRRDETMDDEASPISRTLAQVYDGAADLSYAMWNDHVPGASVAVGGAHAHAKGVLAYANGAGFWLTHSTPMFPKPVGKAGSPFAPASDKYGQSFVCISIGSAGLEVVGKLMALNWPQVFSAADNAGMGQGFTAWAEKSAPEDKAAPQTLAIDITSQGGQEFKAFATRGSWGQDLFEDLVSPNFKRGFLTETWQNGVGKLPNYVEGKDGKAYSETNINEVATPDGDGWESTQDHSKWAISTDHQVFCVGDKNRQHGQRHRGGGTICIQDPSIGEQIAKIIKRTEQVILHV